MFSVPVKVAGLPAASVYVCVIGFPVNGFDVAGGAASALPNGTMKTASRATVIASENNRSRIWLCTSIKNESQPTSGGCRRNATMMPLSFERGVAPHIAKRIGGQPTNLINRFAQAENGENYSSITGLRTTIQLVCEH